MKPTIRNLIGLLGIFTILGILFVSQSSLAKEENNYDNFWKYEGKIDEIQILQLFEGKITGNSILNNEKENNIFIEPDIYNQLEEKDKTTVIIKLKDNFNSYDLEEIKKKSKENIDKILSTLNLEIEVQISQSEKTEDLQKNPDETNVAELDKSENTELKEDSNNFELLYKYESLNALAGKINKEGLEILKNSNLVESVYSEKILQTTLQQSVPLINATRVWSTVTSSGNLTGSGQTVCVVDSGIDYTHPALGGCLGTNCKVKGGIDFINMDFDPTDDSGHGTHVAGIVAANSNTIKGVAPDAKLIAVKSCNATGSCPNTAMIAGVNYCVSNMNNLGTNIITISIGDGGQYTSSNCPTWMDFAINFATSLNIPMTIASGNEAHKSGISYPACSPNAISVGATYDANVGLRSSSVCTDSTTFADKVACFSNSGSNLDVMAPGTIITSTASSTGSRCGAPNPQGLGNCSGTSMATPHVAGTIALMKQLNPTISPAEIESKLKQNGKSVTDLGNNLTFQRIDALKTINDIMQVPWSPNYNLAIGTGNNFDSVIDSNGNSHIIKINNLNLYYTKTDNNGNKLINNMAITTNANISGTPSITIDTVNNIHIVWEDNRNGNPEIYYKKININGTTIVNDTRITIDGWESRNPKIAVDNLQKAHIVFQDNRNSGRWRIYYEKLNVDGSSLINEFIVDNPSLCTPTSTCLNYARNPSISLDNQGNVYLTYEFMYYYYYFPPYATHGYEYKLYYKKLDNNGNYITGDIVLSSQGFGAIQQVDYTNIYDVKSRPDNQGNLYILRKNGLNINLSFPGGNPNLPYYDHSYGYVTNFWKINSSNGVSWVRPVSSLARYGYRFTRDNQNNIHLTWSDPRNGQDEIYYKKIDSNGNIIVNDQRLTFASSPAISSGFPTINIDSNKESHVSFAKNGLIYYKRTMNNLNLEIPQNAVIGTTIPLHIKDITSPNSYYVLALSYGYSPGIPLPDGRIVALNIPLLTSFQGFLDSNGRATAYLAIPNSPQIVGTTIYAAFVTINSTAIQSVSPYFPIQITT